MTVRVMSKCEFIEKAWRTPEAVRPVKNQDKEETMKKQHLFLVFMLLAIGLFLGAVGCSDQADTPTPVPTATSAPTATPAPPTPTVMSIELVPFTDDEAGISGVVPAGWTWEDPGTYIGPDSHVIGQTAIPGGTVEQFTASFLPELGVEELPDRVDSVQPADLVWDLYMLEDVEIYGEQGSLALALAEDDAGAYIIALFAGPDEIEALVETVGNPALAAFTVTGQQDDVAQETPAPEAPTPEASAQADLAKLRQMLATEFSEEELRTLCSDLDIDYDNLRGESKADKTMALIDHLRRQLRLPDLIKVGKRMRPDVAWDDALSASPATPVAQDDVEGGSSVQVDRAELRQMLATEFSKEELQTLCLDLDVDYDDLKGESRADKVRELILYLERRVRLADLINVGKRLRPDLAWDDVVLVSPATPVAQEEEDSEEIKLVPFVDDEMGISGLVPDGWTRVSSGVYGNSEGLAIIQLAVPGASAKDVGIQFLSSTGIAEPPELSGTHDSDTLEWELYYLDRVEIEGATHSAALALAEDAAGAYMVVFMGPSAEIEVLVEDVGTLILDAFSVSTSAPTSQPTGNTLLRLLRFVPDAPEYREYVTFGDAAAWHASWSVPRVADKEWS